MRPRYRLFRRKSGYFFIFDTQLNKQASLKTSDKATANRILHAKNEAAYQPHLNLKIAEAYLDGTDELATTRTWAQALKDLIQSKSGPTRERWDRAAKDKAFALILNRPIRLTAPEHLLQVLKRGTVSTNVHLRKLRNFCLGMGWCSGLILNENMWPDIKFKEKRAITWDEHLRIIDREVNREYRHFYELL